MLISSHGSRVTNFTIYHSGVRIQGSTSVTPIWLNWINSNFLGWVNKSKLNWGRQFYSQPLPAARVLTLAVDDIPDGGADNAFRHILKLAPANKRYVKDKMW